MWLLILLFACEEQDQIRPGDITGCWQVISINREDCSQQDWYYRFLEDGVFIELVYDEQYTPNGEFSISNNSLYIHKYKWIMQDGSRIIVDDGVYRYTIRLDHQEMTLKNSQETIELVRYEPI